MGARTLNRPDIQIKDGGRILNRPDIQIRDWGRILNWQDILIRDVGGHSIGRISSHGARQNFRYPAKKNLELNLISGQTPDISLNIPPDAG